MYKPKREPRKILAVRISGIERKRLYDLCAHYDESASEVVRKLIDERHVRVVK